MRKESSLNILKKEEISQVQQLLELPMIKKMLNAKVHPSGNMK
jgi:hypothetical protein